MSIVLKSLTVEERLCAPVYGHLTLSSVSAIKFETILNKRLCIQVGNRSYYKRYFHGLVYSCCLTAVQQVEERSIYFYRIQFASFIHQLKSQKRFRIFSNKTVSEVLYCLLKPCLVGVNYNIAIKNKKKTNYIQYDITDFEFLQQLISQHHLFYFFHSFEVVETIVIADNYNYQWARNKKFSLIDNKGFNIRKNYCYKGGEKLLGMSDNPWLSAGMMVQIKKTKSIVWIIEKAIHQFRHLCRAISDSGLISTLYKNKFYALKKKSFGVFLKMDNVKFNALSIEDGLVLKHNHNRLEVMCSRAQNRNAVFFERSDWRGGDKLTTNFPPQKSQTVLISFQADSINDGIVLGGLFKPYHSFPFDINSEGISMSSNKSKQLIQFDAKGIDIKSSGDLNQLAGQDIIFEVNGESKTIVHQNMTSRCLKGCFDMQAQSITLCVASSYIKLNGKGISVVSKKVFLN
jgi:hypothetical protein